MYHGRWFRDRLTVHTSLELAGSSDRVRREARGNLGIMLSSPPLAEMPDSSVSAIDIAGERVADNPPN